MNALAISLGMLGLIVLLGLLTLLFYKCYIVIEDRREVANFQMQKNNEKFATNENPSEIYKSPITEYKNPMYGKAVN